MSKKANKKILKLELEIRFNLNGTTKEEIADALERVVQGALDNGTITGATEAEVEFYDYKVLLLREQGNKTGVILAEGEQEISLPEKRNRRIVPLDDAQTIAAAFIGDPDVKTIAQMFEPIPDNLIRQFREKLGYDATYDSHLKALICTPIKGECTGRLDQADFLVGKTVTVPDPSKGDTHHSEFLGTVVIVRPYDTRNEEYPTTLATVEDMEGEGFDIEASRLDMESA